jgi:hypothetical protein
VFALGEELLSSFGSSAESEGCGSGMDSVRQAECRSIEDSDIRLLMRSAGLKGKDFTLVPLSGGKNNRVYRLSTCEAHYLL